MSFKALPPPKEDLIMKIFLCLAPKPTNSLSVMLCKCWRVPGFHSLSGGTFGGKHDQDVDNIPPWIMIVAVCDLFIPDVNSYGIETSIRTASSITVFIVGMARECQWLLTRFCNVITHHSSLRTAGHCQGTVP